MVFGDVKFVSEIHKCIQYVRSPRMYWDVRVSTRVHVYVHDENVSLWNNGTLFLLLRPHRPHAVGSQSSRTDSHGQILISLRTLLVYLLEPHPTWSLARDSRPAHTHITHSFERPTEWRSSDATRTSPATTSSASSSSSESSRSCSGAGTSSTPRRRQERPPPRPRQTARRTGCGRGPKRKPVSDRSRRWPRRERLIEAGGP